VLLSGISLGLVWLDTHVVNSNPYVYVAVLCGVLILLFCVPGDRVEAERDPDFPTNNITAISFLFVDSLDHGIFTLYWTYILQSGTSATNVAISSILVVGGWLYWFFFAYCNWKWGPTRSLLRSKKIYSTVLDLSQILFAGVYEVVGEAQVPDGINIAVNVVSAIDLIWSWISETVVKESRSSQGEAYNL